MDSSETTKAKDIPVPNVGMDALRARTISESSDQSSPTRFVLPGTSGSPPKILTFEEVQDAVKNIENMQLAHEIAINSEFKLQPYEPPENSMEKIIKDTIHRAFWDVLREQLSRQPPCYDMAIQMLIEIKDAFKTIFSDNNVKALARVNEILDETVIRQQAEQNVLDFKAHAEFIIRIMKLCCAPVRDEQVQKLNDIEDIVDMFRGILDTLSIMKLDMANCILDAARNEVIANSVEYEKQKFKKFLDLYKHGFPNTEAWLKRNKLPVAGGPSTSSQTSDQQGISKGTIFYAFLELLDYNEDNAFPEMFQMDQERLITLQVRAARLCVCSSVLAITSAGIPVIGQSVEGRKNLAKELMILLQNCNSKKEIGENLENIWLHAKSVIISRLAASEAKLDEAVENALKSQILQIANKDSPVRSLMWKRLFTYVNIVLRTNNQTQVPPGYGEFDVELQSLATAFKRVTYYNYAVYGEYYHEMLNKI